MLKVIYIKISLILLFLTAVNIAMAQDDKRERLIENTPPPGDTSVVENIVEPIYTGESESGDRFYDTVHSRSSRGGFNKVLYGSIFRRPRKDTTEIARVVDEVKLFERYQGKIIADIFIECEQVYDSDSRGLRRYANKVHRMTRKRIIQYELLFKVGDKVNASELVRNKQMILSRDYIASVGFELVVRENDTTLVDVVVRTRDMWSIGLSAKFRSHRRTTIGIYDANFLGTGNELLLETNFNRKTFNYGGNRIQIDNQNLFGTFYKTRVVVGRRFKDETYSIRIHKDLIMPTDYMLGVSLIDEQSEYHQVYLDTVTIVKMRGVDFWSGKSFYLPSMKSSIYLTARYTLGSYTKRPISTNHRFNPAFHSYDNLLFGFGFYREKFYANNLIYGYGNREYLAAGFKAELIGGYSWGEFDNDIYMGLTSSGGGFTSIGYLWGRGRLGSYINPSSGRWWRSSAELSLKWISPLLRYRRSNIRQFIALHHTRGWNRGGGTNELMQFTDDRGPRTIDENLIGINRMVLSTETVIFSPFQPFGFRVAIFGFADFGFIGNHGNIFKNAFATTFGLGVRLRNENLVFNTIQIQLGLAVGNGGLLKNRYLRISSEPHIDANRFMPQKPEPVKFE